MQYTILYLLLFFLDHLYQLLNQNVGQKSVLFLDYQNYLEFFLLLFFFL